jgi:signal transduction histidine kinase
VANFHPNDCITALPFLSELTGEQQALVESIKFSADLLLSLISDILDLSKIEAGAVDLVEVWLAFFLIYICPC